MPKYFADAWFYVALMDRRDSHHAHAVRLAGVISAHQIVTHDAVFAEVLAYFAEDGRWARQTAVDSVRKTMRISQVLPADRRLFNAALDRYSARPDKEFSLVDCMSMVVMEEQDIHHVLTNDHHFAQAGFTLVNQ